MIQKISMTLGIVAIIIAVVSISGTILQSSLNPSSTPQYTLYIGTDNSETISEIDRICSNYLNKYIILDAKSIQNETEETTGLKNIIIVHVYKTDKTTVIKAAERMFKELPLTSIIIEESQSIAVYQR